VELSAAGLESLRSELSEFAEREAYLKAQLELSILIHEAQTSGWAALPVEPPPVDDAEVDDWLPRFVALQGPCLFFYLLSTVDLSPQDSTLLADTVEVGSLLSYTREFDETHHCFYILTRQGLRFECSSTSTTQTFGELNFFVLEVYNLGTGNGTSVLEMVSAFEKASGKKMMVGRRPGDAQFVYSST
ncbi:hypothetical protein HID58_056669, partial [Brassica napus]